MPVPSSGAVSISDLVDEFGGTAPHSLSEYYRDAGLVPSNNTSVPASGLFRMSNARGAVNEIAVAATSGTNVDLSSLFGSNWTSTVPKRLTVGSGVTIGGTGSSAAIIIPSNMAGTLEIDNSGSILGFGGSANGGNGGNAINNSASGVTINNTGTIAGGGGGGGQGGTGGNGSFSQTVRQPTSGFAFNSSATYWRHDGPYRYVDYGNTYRYDLPTYYSGTSYSVGGYTWYKGSFQYSFDDGEGSYYSVARTYNQTTSSTGGSGGSGGQGQGYNQSNASGSSGSAGGTNAGAGGSGGNGATYGNAGATGSTGANGNVSNGSAGSSGGSAGAAVAGTTVTMNNTGSVYGAVA